MVNAKDLKTEIVAMINDMLCIFTHASKNGTAVDDTLAQFEKRLGNALRECCNLGILEWDPTDGTIVYTLGGMGEYTTAPIVVG